LHYTSGNAPGEAECPGNPGALGARRSLGGTPTINGRSGADAIQSGSCFGNDQGGESEDSVRRSMKAHGRDRQWDQWMKRPSGKARLRGHCCRRPWVLDVDTTVKPLYGHQQDARVGYNPTKPGRPSHAYHSLLRGEYSGWCWTWKYRRGRNQTAPLYGQPETVGIPGRTSGARTGQCFLAWGQPLGSRRKNHGWGAEGAKPWVPVSNSRQSAKREEG